MTAFQTMATDGGPHPPHKWALQTAREIVVIEPTASGENLLAGEALRVKIATALVPHHASNQDGTKSALATDSAAVHAAPVDPDDVQVNAAVDAVLDAFSGTPWEAQAAEPEARAKVYATIHGHFSHAQEIERSWHIDINGAPVARES